MEVADAKRLTALETENVKLKKMLVEQMMHVVTLKEMLGRTSDARFEKEGGGWAMKKEKGVRVHYTRDSHRHLGSFEVCQTGSVSVVDGGFAASGLI